MKMNKTLLTIGILGIGGVLLWYFASLNRNRIEPGTKQYADTDIVMRVGHEDIYGKDLSYELAQYPPEGEDKEQIVLQKIAADSVLLQGVREDGLMELDETFYNSLSKDYELRIAMVSQAKSLVELRGESITGSVVSLWFRNNNWIGPDGLESGKQTAFRKMTDLRNRVVNGSVTIQEVAEIIKNDAANERLDRVYKNNAYFEFTAMKGQEKWITLSKDLDQELWTLPVGRVSKLYVGTGVDENTGESYDALYLFGEVSSRNTTGEEYMSFDQWLENKKEIYEVEYL
jgi:hypothetical protein